MAKVSLFMNVTKHYGNQVVIPDSIWRSLTASSSVLVGPRAAGRPRPYRWSQVSSRSRAALLIGGQRRYRLPPKERDIAMVFQSYALFPHMNVIAKYRVRPEDPAVS